MASNCGIHGLGNSSITGQRSSAARSSQVNAVSLSALKASDFEVVQLGWAPSVALVVALPASVKAGTAAT